MTQRIYDLEQELAYTQGNLQTTIEALEATNEQLQSTNEELVAANEELQSTNEELHAVNEELYTVNSEYQNKIQELMQLNDDMDNLMRSTDAGTMILDTALQLRKYTPTMTSVIPLTSQDIGRSIDDLALPFTGISWRQDIDDVLVQQRGMEKEVVSSEGDWFLLRMLPFISEEGSCEGVVLSFVDMTRLKITEALLQEERYFWQLLLDTFDMQIAILDWGGGILHVNQAWHGRIATHPGEAVLSYTGLPYTYVFQEVFGVNADVSLQVSQGLHDVLAGTRSVFTMAYPCPSTNRQCLMRISRLVTHDPARVPGYIMIIHEDGTARRQVAGESGASPINPQCQPHQSTPTAGALGTYPSEWARPDGLAQNYPSVSSQ